MRRPSGIHAAEVWVSRAPRGQRPRAARAGRQEDDACGDIRRERENESPVGRQPGGYPVAEPHRRPTVQRAKVDAVADIPKQEAPAIGAEVDRVGDILPREIDLTPTYLTCR